MAWLRWIYLLSVLTSIALLLSITATSSLVDLKITRAFWEISNLERAVQSWSELMGQLPEQLDQVTAHMKGARQPHPFKDPWGNDYQYRPRSPTRNVVYSMGADGRDQGGEGDDVTVPGKHYECATYGVDCPLSIQATLAVIAAGLALCMLVAGLGVRWRLARTRAVRSTPRL